MFRKSVWVFALCLMLVVIPIVPAAAQMDSSTKYGHVTPRMNYISMMSADLSINIDGVATVDCWTDGYPGTTTKISISAKLQQYKGGKWVTIKTFTASGTDSVNLSKTYGVATGYSYRALATVTAYSGTDKEIQTVSSSEADY